MQIEPNIQDIVIGQAKPKENIIRNIEIDFQNHLLMIKNIAKYHNENYLFTKQIELVSQLLLLYFTGDINFMMKYEEMTEQKGSLNKGLMIVGDIGTGKSELFSIFRMYSTQVNRLNGFKSYTSGEIVDNLNIVGKAYFQQFSHNYQAQGQAKPITCYVDDIGSRNETVMHYGSKYNAMEEFLNIRYEVYKRYRKLTHLSTNLYPSEIKEIYGNRIENRMKEMFNIIELKGESFRK